MIDKTDGIEKGDTARIIYRSKRSGNNKELSGEVVTVQKVAGETTAIGVKDRENERTVVAKLDEEEVISKKRAEEPGSEDRPLINLGILREVSSPHIYRVWLSGDNVSGGRRELARYKAYTMKQVEDIVKEEQFEEVPPGLQAEGDGTDRVYLTWTEKISQDELGLTDEEYEEALEYGEAYNTMNIEIQKDNSANFPMNVITGGTAGRDLT